MDKQTFINLVKDGAIQGLKQFHIFASVTIAQAILESGWGQYTHGNNLFGIKWTDGCGYASQNLPTKECINGQWQNVNSLFRAYPSYSESILDHARLLTTSRYAAVINSVDYKSACQSLQNCGYATDPNYANLLTQIIEQNNLQQYDVIIQSSPTISSFQQACNDAGYTDKNNNKLVVDGVRGDLTDGVIAKIFLEKGSQGNLVKWVQQRLIDLGFSCGSCGVDGDFGKFTFIAVQRFQASKGLKSDGIVGLLTIDKLI